MNALRLEERRAAHGRAGFAALGAAVGLLALLLILAGRTNLAFAEPPAIYNLGTLPGSVSIGYAINGSGQVTGTSGGARLPAFLYTGTPGSGGVMLDLGTLGGSSGTGFAINASGQVAGWSTLSSGDGGPHAFVYTGTPGSGGAMRDLGTLGGTQSCGTAISASGQVAGYSFVTGNAATHAFLYTGDPGSGGANFDLGTLGGTESRAFAINANGQIAGDSSLADDSMRAFLYTGTPGSGGTMKDLGTLGGPSSGGYAINASGQIAGWSTLSGTSSAYHAFRYTGTPGSGGAMVDLGTLGGTRSEGRAINASGQVAGWSTLSSGSNAHRAFLYTGTPGAGGRMIDLDAWLDANNPTEGAKWRLDEAYGLNDSGLITGQGSYNDGPGGLSDGTRAFVLDARSLQAEPRLFVIAVGTNDRNLLNWEIMSGQADARAVEAKFKSFSSFSQSRLLLYDYNTNADVTPLRTAINEIESLARPNDTVVFYYGGHGAGAVGWDESLEITENVSVSDDDLTSWFRTSKWNQINKLFILDSCFSGGFAGGTDKPGDGTTIDLMSLPKAALIAAATEAGFSGSTGFSLPPGRGVFTLELEKALTLVDGYAKADRDKDGLSFSDLESYLHEQMATLGTYEGFIRADPYENDLGDTPITPQIGVWQTGDFEIQVPEPSAIATAAIVLLFLSRRWRAGART